MPGPTILHIEDDAGDVLLLEQAFRQAGLSVRLHRAADGEEALAYLEGKGKFANRSMFPLPSLVLLDLKLLGFTGLEVLHWIRQSETFHGLPVVVLSSSDRGIEIERSYEAGANSYLVKPVGFEALVQLVKVLHHYWFELNQWPTARSGLANGQD